MKFLLLTLAIAMSTGLAAQYSVHIKLSPLTGQTAAESVYVAGSFNGWNPKDETFRLRKDDKGNF